MARIVYDGKRLAEGIATALISQVTGEPIWIPRRIVRPAREVEKEYGLPPGTLYDDPHSRSLRVVEEE